MIRDIAKLQERVEGLAGRGEEQHREIIDRFDKLTSKVNEEITTMNKTIDSTIEAVRANRRFYIKLLILTIIAGSLIWIGESREWILQHIFHFI